MSLRGVWRVAWRRRALSPPSGLTRYLGPAELIAVGVSSALGAGVYVLVGHVALQLAGPAVLLSFLLAASASLMAGLCYAEFTSRAPRSGSAYVYSYICVGELIAFVVGWSLVLEYVIGAASVARGISLYLDILFADSIKNTFRWLVPMDMAIFSEYFDLLAFGVPVVLGVMLAIGLKRSFMLNNMFTLLNICIIVFIVIIGSMQADSVNWQLENVPPGAGVGGFFPFGTIGMLRGAATCFYGFIGFDSIASSAEEALQPRRSLPVAILSTLAIVSLAYLGVATVLTLMVPYYEQDAAAPLPAALATVGLPWAQWVVTIGALIGLFSSLFGAMFPLPHILYTMAEDMLVPHCLGVKSARFHNPVLGTMLVALLTGSMAGLFDLTSLVHLLSIGTLLAYSVVAACILLLRYEGCSPEEAGVPEGPGRTPSLTFAPLHLLLSKTVPSAMSFYMAASLLALYCVLSLALAAVILWQGSLSAIVILSALLLLILLLLSLLPRCSPHPAFQVPLVPLLPCVSISVNLGLMLLLDSSTWLRFGMWMAVGLLLYFGSLCIYKRGPNYIINVQKSSHNGHSSGNINYTFENVTECQERSEVKIVVHAPTPPASPAAPDIESSLQLLDSVLRAHEDSEPVPPPSPLLGSVHTNTLAHVATVQHQAVELFVCAEPFQRVQSEHNLAVADDIDITTDSTEDSTDQHVYTNVSIIQNEISQECEILKLQQADVGSTVNNGIPPAPPLDDNFFNIRNVSKWKQKRKSKAETIVDPIKSDHADKVIHLGTERRNSFLKRLNTLLKNQSGTRNIKGEALKRSHSSDVLRGLDSVELRHKGTPTEQEGSSTSLTFPLPHEDLSFSDDTPLSKTEMKTKLEAIFAVSPAMIRFRFDKEATDTAMNVKLNDSDDSEPPIVSTEERLKAGSDDCNIQKPITSDIYTNTMRLQRARFGDVLKSIQMVQSKRASEDNLNIKSIDV